MQREVIADSEWFDSRDEGKRRGGVFLSILSIRQCMTWIDQSLAIHRLTEENPHVWSDLRENEQIDISKEPFDHWPCTFTVAMTKVTWRSYHHRTINLPKIFSPTLPCVTLTPRLRLFGQKIVTPKSGKWKLYRIFVRSAPLSSRRR
jgi:hypothetical protein